MDQEIAQQNPPAQPTKESPDVLKVILIVLAVILLMAISAFVGFWYKAQMDKKSNPLTTKTPETNDTEQTATSNQEINWLTYQNEYKEDLNFDYPEGADIDVTYPEGVGGGVCEDNGCPKAIITYKDLTVTIEYPSAPIGGFARAPLDTPYKVVAGNYVTGGLGKTEEAEGNNLASYYFEFMEGGKAFTSTVWGSILCKASTPMNEKEKYNEIANKIALSFTDREANPKETWGAAYIDRVNIEWENINSLNIWGIRENGDDYLVAEYRDIPGKDISHALISPGGEYIAVSTHTNSKYYLTIYDLDQGKKVSFEGDTQPFTENAILNGTWVSENRFVVPTVDVTKKARAEDYTGKTTRILYDLTTREARKITPGECANLVNQAYEKYFN